MTCKDGSYEKEVREARNRVPLAELGIEQIKIRRAVTGAYIFEITGETKAAKADLLATKFRETVGAKEGVKIARPCKKADLRVKGLDASITLSEALKKSKWEK